MRTTIKENKAIIFLIIPLFLSAFTHLWNTVGFPDQSSDDGTYIRRAMNVLKGFGLQESSLYDHPYFGQLFLAGIFKIIGFPGSFYPQSTDLKDITHSIQLLYTIPRVIMGGLAVVDTFLIYKISQYRYNRNVAFIASILFAITPCSWLFRRIYLDPLQTPFLLSSILFVIYMREQQIKDNSNTLSNTRNTLLLTSLSGIFLGLSIFTKIPAITVIPLVAYLVYTGNNNAKWKNLGLWFIPVILIPAIWPAYAISIGEFDKWINSVIHQSIERKEISLLSAFLDISRIDPVLLFLGFAGFVYATIKREYLFLLWIIPFLIFYYLVGHVRYNYMVPISPAFCSAGAVLIVEPIKKIKDQNKRVIQQILPFAVISSIGAFGLITSFILITTDATSSQIKASAFVAHKIIQDKVSNNVTIISPGGYSWVYRDVFDQPNVFDNFVDRSPIKTKKVIMITDSSFKTFLKNTKTKQGKRISSIYAKTESIATFKEGQKYDYKKYPNFSIKRADSGFNIDVRSNY